MCDVLPPTLAPQIQRHFINKRKQKRKEKQSSLVTEVDFFNTCFPPPLNGSNGGIIRLLSCLQTAVRRSPSWREVGHRLEKHLSVVICSIAAPRLFVAQKKAKRRFHACFQRPRPRTSTHLKRPWEHFQHWITTPTVTFRRSLQFYHFYRVFLALGSSRVAPAPLPPHPRR